MDAQEILIKIKTEFQDQAVKAARVAFAELGKSATEALTTTDGRVKLLTSTLGNLKTAARTAGAAFKTIASGALGLGKSIIGLLNPLKLLNTMFGRISIAVGIWQFWRTAKRGFLALTEAVVGTNAAIQTAQASFTALTGSTKAATGLIAIARDVAIETGASFSDLVFQSRRLTTQLGKNQAAFRQVSRQAVALSVLDPDQGISGAMFAISGFLEGTAQGARSLAQRFELPFSVLKQALEDAADPVEALALAFQRLGIDVDDLIERGRYTLPVVFSNLKEIARGFLQVLGEPVVKQFTADLARLRDWLDENRAAIQGLAIALGRLVERIYLAGRAMLQGLFPGLSAIFNIKLPEFADQAREIGSGVAETIGEGVKEGLELAAGEAALDSLLGSEKAQKQAVKDVERWVKEAADIVQAKRDELSMFNLMTEDIPERFTRGKRRQMELDIMTAEKEHAIRQDALALAREQLRAVQEQVAGQRELVKALKDVAKAAEDSPLTSGDIGIGGDIETAFDDSAINAWADAWGEKFESFAQKAEETIGRVGQFLRGVFGLEAASEMVPGGKFIPFETAYESGVRLRELITSIGDTLANVVKGIKPIVEFLFQSPEEAKQDVVQVAKTAHKNLGSWLTETAKKLGLNFGSDLAKGSEESLAGAGDDMEKAAETGVSKPVQNVFQELFNKIVGNSILPDMLDNVVGLYRELPTRLTPHLQNLYSVIIRTMEMVSFEWNQKWVEMTMTAQTSILSITESYTQLENMLQAIQHQNQQLQHQQATSTVGSGMSGAMSGAVSGLVANIHLELNAEETRRLCQEGQYEAFVTVLE
jgi:hypothetical protein